MTTSRRCPQCRQPLALPEGPPNALIGMLHFQPLTGRDLTDANRILSNELYAVGINSLLTRRASLWPHPPNKTDNFEKHLATSLKAVQKCGVVLLFGTHVTKAVLGQGIAGILGLTRTSPLLPGVALLPALSPEDVPGKTLGEFRWVMQTLAKLAAKL